MPGKPAPGKPAPGAPSKPPPPNPPANPAANPPRPDAVPASAPKEYSRNASDHFPSECSREKASTNFEAYLPAASLSSRAARGVMLELPAGAPNPPGAPRPPPPCWAPPSALFSVPTGFSSVTLGPFLRIKPTANVYPRRGTRRLSSQR